MEEIFDKLAQAVVDMEEDDVAELAQYCVDNNIDAFDAIDKGLTRGMEEAGKLFEEEEYFVPELLSCADAMNVGIDILKPYLAVDETAEKKKVVLGVVEGDTHDIGKNLVGLMLETAGFEVHDIGRDVSPEVFVQKGLELNADILCISTLMTTTMDAMGAVVTKLEEKGVRDQFKVMVGGGPISSGFAKKIGADGYSKNAADAVKLAKELTGVA